VTVTPTVSPGNSFRSAALGFEFERPPSLDQPTASRCQPRETSDGLAVEIGTNIKITMEEAASGRTPAAAATAFLSRAGARAEATSHPTVSETDAVRVDYRLEQGARFGIATFVVRYDRLYTLVFEARDLSQCGGIASAELYEAILEGFNILP
jgi:hypothetical protein